ncbi:cell division protein FtsZ [Candidatus Campbellbacteria bacterium]|nr:MAG: cell division protein FtsZ [Candidatus Campbellbacteria bacterium]
MAEKKTNKKTTSKRRVQKVSLGEKRLSKKQELILPKITVVGIGGSGNNAINYMIRKDVKNVKFIAINTDLQDLNQTKASKKIKIGESLTNGSGAGMNPEIGKKSALESADDIADALKDTQMVFLACGMGGGTGTGATPIIAQIAKDLGILTIAVVTKPFSFEGKVRTDLAKEGIENLSTNVDSYIVIENDKILETSGEDASLEEAFALSDEVLKQAVEGISDLITKPGIINIDYADIKSVLEESKLSLIGIGSARGEDRAKQSASAAINSPLIETSTKGAKSILFSIASGGDLKMSEVHEIANFITEEASEEAIIKSGTVKNPKLKKGELKVTVIASNFDNMEEDFYPQDVKSFGLPIASDKKEEVEEEKKDEENTEDNDVTLGAWVKSLFNRKKDKKEEE